MALSLKVSIDWSVQFHIKSSQRYENKNVIMCISKKDIVEKKAEGSCIKRNRLQADFVVYLVYFVVLLHL